MVTKKDKRHSGRYTPRIIKPQMSYDEMKVEALEPQENYDEWLSHKDGMRDWGYLKWKEEDKKKRRRRWKNNSQY